MVDLPQMEVKGKYHPRYSLCAKTVAERDAWVASISEAIKTAMAANDTGSRAKSAEQLRASWATKTSFKPPSLKPPPMMMGDFSEAAPPPMMGDATPRAPPPMMGDANPRAPPSMMTNAPPVPAPAAHSA